ncbi:bifunctional UDP-N-acetylglucosamine pyrophosphorylase / Glucosamine-1-phosphate N-acetyltransferase [Seinonella peptonophila]|uniref:Bifunctional protein GlmU n=1 Tax=Seinonella peptonophila TaxID=112248 RepID=A0A1M4YM90_9BACL|nr:bifunctional UDP-N-acetylglucosamine diphosphorylase/glucosamine-1-phosphate N-acetyltransferase GlmU [Seinonella peptonophila]SHF06861.1 bifunctional UDP-N-acetylglucosamine pyrophosphorylase / Glucosamine-1-phosphate N-acetyltransferase [Seinonella peptonophila]
MGNLYAVVLAAGKGTRMKSKKHKVLHSVCGKPIIDHVLDRLHELGCDRTICVIGYQGDTLREHLEKKHAVTLVEQKEQLGTAHAIMQAKDELASLEGTTLVMNGDHPLFTLETLQRLVRSHQEKRAAATVLTADLDDPAQYGRVIRNGNHSVQRIVEYKDASEEERQITEINTGTFCFDNQKLFSVIHEVNNNNAQKEYYLPDVLSLLLKRSELVHAVKVHDAGEAMGVNDRQQLAEADAYMRQMILQKHMEEGVTIVDTSNTYIEPEVFIGADTVIHPGTFLRGTTMIGEDCQIGPQADLTDMVIDDEVSIKYTVASGSRIEKETTVGPYVYMRPQTHLRKRVKIGCFIDLKKAELGDGTKVSHLAYVGDARVGKKVNISCGVVTVNYDGKNKFKTIIGDNAFIGCNVNLVAPVHVKKGAYVAAGSTITNDVPEKALAIARERQTNKPGYVEKLWAKRSQQK